MWANIRRLFQQWELHKVERVLTGVIQLFIDRMEQDVILTSGETMEASQFKKVQTRFADQTKSLNDR